MFLRKVFADLGVLASQGRAVLFGISSPCTIAVAAALVVLEAAHIAAGAEAGKVVHLASGAAMECRSVTVGEDHVVITLERGSMKIPKAMLAPKSLEEFYPAQLPASDPASLPAPPAGAARQPIETKAAGAPAPGAGAANAAASLRLPEALPAALQNAPPDFPPPPPKQKVVQETFTLPSKLYGNKIVKVHYRVPLVDGKPGPNAHNMVFYAPYFCQRKFFERPYQKELTERLGFTFFSFEITTKMEDVEDYEKCYYYAESGAHDLVFEAQKRLVEKYNLAPRKLLVMGDSGGATMAQRLANANPHRIEAVAIVGGHRFDESSASSPLPWCVLTTRGDDRLEDCRKLVKQLREGGANVLAAVTPPEWRLRGGTHFDHTASETAEAILCAFISGVARNREQKITNPAAWPLVSDAASPRRVLPRTERVLAGIPAERRRFVPSGDFVRAWAAQPVPPHEIRIPVSSGALKLRIARPSGPAKGIVVCHQRFSALTWAAMAPDLDYLAEHGFVAVWPRIAEQETDPRGLLGEAIEWVAGQPELQRLPIIVAGFEEGAAEVISLLGGRSIPRLAGIACVELRAGSKEQQQSLEQKVRALPCPLLLIMDEAGGEAMNAAAGLMRVAEFYRKEEQLATLAAAKEAGQKLQKRVELVRVFADTRAAAAR